MERKLKHTVEERKGDVGVSPSGKERCAIKRKRKGKKVGSRGEAII